MISVFFTTEYTESHGVFFIPLLRGARGVLEHISMGMFSSINCCVSHTPAPLKRGDKFVSSAVNPLRHLVRNYFLRFLGILDGYLREGERSQGIGKHTTRTEVDFRTLDEVLIVVFFGEGTLAVE